MEQRWIPVSEQLPEKNKKVIISTKTENLYFGIYCQNVDSTKDGIFLSWNNAYMRMDMVAAWMPLPEPYRGEEPKQTNADRIRSMADEELAANMMCPNENGLAEIDCDKNDNCNCYECLLK